LRQAGKWMGTVRRMASDFQGQVNAAMREAELDELRREVTGLKADLDGLGPPVPRPADDMKSLAPPPKPKAKRAPRKKPEPKT
jgi:sec-independent protein translocase protein TatB